MQDNLGPWKQKQITTTQDAIDLQVNLELTEEEAHRHDAIFYHEALATLEDKDMDDPGISKHWDKVREHLDWFREHNAKAYYVLLD